jgi:hypothetical protein
MPLLRRAAMPSGQLLIGNDHVLYFVGLRRDDDFSFLTGKTVSASVVTDEEGLTVVTNGGPVSLSDINIGADDIGGTAASPTVVKSVDGRNVVVTVGGTNALALTAGRLIRVIHDPQVWRVRLAAAGAAESDVTIHLEPFIYDGNTVPRKVKMTVGEIMEIEDGSYSGSLDKAFEVEAGTSYWVKYTVDAGSGLDGEWVEEVTAAYRSSS